MGKPHIFSVSELNSACRQLLESQFPNIWVTGEISNLACPSSGHYYFSLKDQLAQIKCALFRGRAQRLNLKPEDGLQVLVQARVSLYEGRGDFQLIIEHLEPCGDGALRRQFEQLKQKLLIEGLFNTERKKLIPRFPKQIGVITSPTGAAVRDILITLQRRFATIPVIIYPTDVQGKAAAPKIVTSIQQANSRNECDVLLLARGGGSLEDLWPFNEEIVARAIVNSKIPIITGIGHEIDTTIADLVADYRAATPTAAAETATPNLPDIIKLINQYQLSFSRWIQYSLQHYQFMLSQLKKRIRHPHFHLREVAQRLDYLEQRLNLAIDSLLKANKLKLHNIISRLDALSPLTTLKRGYAIVYNSKDQIVSNSRQVSTGDKIRIQLSEGNLTCKVE